METRRNAAVGQVVHKQLKAVDAERTARRTAEHRARLAVLQEALSGQRKEMLVGAAPLTASVVPEEACGGDGEGEYGK
jgi:hypothetical protein